MMNWGAVPIGSVLPFNFASYDGATGASEAISGLAVTDIEIYKNGSITQRSSDAGYTLIDTDGIDIDGIVGANGFTIDTGDNTDAGFYAAGSFYIVWVSSVTADGQTVNFIAGYFRLVAVENTAGTPVVDIGRISGDSGAADNMEADYDGTGYTKTNSTIGTATTLTNAPSDPAGVTTLLSRLSALRAGYLDNLSAGAVALAATALSTAQWTNGRAANLDNLDAAISTRSSHTANQVRDAVFARAFSAAYGALTFDQAISVVLAVLTGKTTGAATATVTFRNLDDSADVVVATMASGNRSAVVITP